MRSSSDEGATIHHRHGRRVRSEVSSPNGERSTGRPRAWLVAEMPRQVLEKQGRAVVGRVARGRISRAPKPGRSAPAPTPARHVADALGTTHAYLFTRLQGPGVWQTSCVVVGYAQRRGARRSRVGVTSLAWPAWIP